MSFDIMMAIAKICPGAVYHSDFVNNTKEEYDAIVWFDFNTCPKPTWEELVEVMKPTKAEVYTEKMQSIADQFQGFLTAFNAQYTDEERATWPVQIEEAYAITTGTGAPTPFLESFVITRGKGETKEELAAKIMDNNDIYRSYWGNLAGQEQSFRAAVETVMADYDATAEDLALVNVTFTAPPLA